MFWDQYVIYYNFNVHCTIICHVTTENFQNIWVVDVSYMKAEMTSRPASTVTSSPADMLY